MDIFTNIFYDAESLDFFSKRPLWPFLELNGENTACDSKVMGWCIFEMFRCLLSRRDFYRRRLRESVTTAISITLFVILSYKEKRETEKVETVQHKAFEIKSSILCAVNGKMRTATGSHMVKSVSYCII